MILFTATNDGQGATTDDVDYSDCVDILVTDDVLIEDDHTFTVAVITESLTTNDNVANELTFTIQDDDGNTLLKGSRCMELSRITKNVLWEKVNRTHPSIQVTLPSPYSRLWSYRGHGTSFHLNPAHNYNTCIVRKDNIFHQTATVAVAVAAAVVILLLLLL